MNFSKLIGAALIIFILLSCSGDDSISENNLLIGTWYVEKILLNGIDKNLNECDKRDNFQFTSSNKVIETAYYYISNPSECSVAGRAEGNWKVENEILIINWPDAEEADNPTHQWPILELTPTTLTLRMPYDGGVDEITFKK